MNVLEKNLEKFLTKIYADITKASNNGCFYIELDIHNGFDYDNNQEAKEILKSQGYSVYRSHFSQVSGYYVWCIAWDKEEHEDCEEDNSLDYTR